MEIGAYVMVFKNKPLLLLALLLSQATLFAASVPANITIQGYLYNSTNNASLTGTHQFTFNIWDNYTNGNSLYNNSQNLTTDFRGFWMAVIQNVNVNLSNPTYLGVQVDNNSEIAPRTNITTVPYSYISNQTYDVRIDNLIGNKSGTGNCGAGQFVQNSTAGAPQCATPATTTYTNGTGLNLTATTFSIKVCADNQSLVYNTTSSNWECRAGAVGTMTSITAGYGLNSTTITQSGTLNVNDSVMQNRLTGSCTYGVASVAQSGAVSCAAQQGTVTSIATTGGITGGTITGTGTLSLDLTYMNANYLNISSQIYNETPQINNLNTTKAAIGTCSANQYAVSLGTGALVCSQPSTTNVTEGNNLYFTTLRVVQAVGNYSGENATIVRTGTFQCTGTQKLTNITANSTGIYGVCSADLTGAGIATVQAADATMIIQNGTTSNFSVNVSYFDANYYNQTNANATFVSKTAQVRITSSPLFVNGVTLANIDNGFNLSMTQANSTVGGFLTAVDWLEFDNKSQSGPSGVCTYGIANFTLMNGSVPQVACASQQAGGNVTSTGSSGYIAQFENASNVNNSLIFQNGSYIGIGVTNPNYTLYVSGNLSLASYMDYPAISQPAAPGAGVARLHAVANNGFTRLEVDNTGATDAILSRDNIFIAKNTAGFQLNKSQAVYITGATGNVPNVGLAQANSTTTMPMVGLVLDNISINGFGQVMILGIISGVDTSAFSVGDQLYLNATSPGAFTKIRPTNPNLVQRIGSVLVSGVGNGAILVDIAPFIGNSETGTIYGFNITGDLNLSTICPGGSVLTTDANGKVKCVVNNNGTVTSVTNGTGILGGPITTSGTLSLDASWLNANYLNISNQLYNESAAVSAVNATAQALLASNTTTNLRVTELNTTKLGAAENTTINALVSSNTTINARVGNLNDTKAAIGASAACTYGVANLTLNAQSVAGVTCAAQQGTVTSVACGAGMNCSAITTTGTVQMALSPVTPNGYGGAATVGTFTVNGTGQLTAAANVSIAIAATQVTSGTFADARLSSNVTLNNANTISAGTLGDARLSANVTINNANVTFTKNVTINSDANLFVYTWMNPYNTSQYARWVNASCYNIVTASVNETIC